jgi:photosystem II stability/assembly factor-like uncharacterized protein
MAGPPGGDARTIVAAPGQSGRLYLGSTNSWIYESSDNGASWRRLARMDNTDGLINDGLILDSIVVDSADPKRIYVGAWKADSNEGGLWVSRDEGKSWSELEGMRGQSIRALAQAPSNPRILFAGTLDGVFRSENSGATWTQISPPGSKEIHEVESLAVDPANPQIVYAGTWHLPWKTENGGKTWRNIKQGIIDDSDVFSIIVDGKNSRIVYLSACSGIYKSENGGDRFRKIQGIPSTARRTRSLAQDPKNHQTVYAGTTEGLYKTVDGGRKFLRTTGPDVVVNGVHVDPADSNNILLATDRSGVLASHDGAVTFAASNDGFSERKVKALLVDRTDARRLYAGVVNDKTYGGVFISNDAGSHWEQAGIGLDGRDVFALSETKDGTIVAGTSRGIFVLDSTQRADNTFADPPPTWQPKNTIANTVVKIASQNVRGTKVNIEKEVKSPVIQLESRVNALDVSGETWAAATSYGLVTSRDKGASWQGGPVMGSGEYLSVTALGETMAAARADGAVLSNDGGKSWRPMGLPKMLTRIHRILFSPDGTLWVGAREGVYFSSDKGKSWMWIERLPLRDVDDLSYDPGEKRILVSSQSSDQVFGIDPRSMTWKWWQTGYRIALIRTGGGRLVATSVNDGILLGPNIEEPETSQK